MPEKRSIKTLIVWISGWKITFILNFAFCTFILEICSISTLKKKLIHKNGALQNIYCRFNVGVIFIELWHKIYVIK